jgi:DNA-binding transcriptional LysR family regulator
MNACKIQILLTCIETGSMMQAAESLGYTPSGLSHMMDALEADLGVKIIKRDKHGISLTGNGEQLMPLLREYTEAEQKIRNEVYKLLQSKKDPLRLGAYACIARNWLPHIVNGFKSQCSNADIEIVVLDREKLHEALRIGVVDMIFASNNGSDNYEFIPLKKDFYRAVLPHASDVHLTNDDFFDLHDFNKYTFIMPSYGKNSDVQTALKKYGIHPTLFAATADYPIVLSMVAGGLGVSMLSELILLGCNEQVEILPIKPQICRILGLIVKPLSAQTMVETKFISYVKSITL